MRVLVLTLYFEPDLCAGSFRNTALVRQLAGQMSPNDRLDVITTLPNRYGSFSVDAPEREDCPPLRVKRIALPAHQGGMIDQSRAFLRYASGVRKAVKGQQYDVVYASSSRLMTAVLGAAIADACKAALYLDIRDIFTETIGDMFRNSPVRVVVPVFRALEKRTIRRADRINLAIPGFLSHFEGLDSRKEYRQFTNGIDEEFIACDFANQKTDGAPIKVLYAGNIGEGQGLHRILPDAARRLKDEYEFVVVGDGGRRSALEDAIKGIPNITIQDPVPRNKLLEYYRDADVLFMHLNDYPVFRNAIPSKLFEYAATGKPIVAGVEGQTAEFVTREIANAAVFRPCDVTSFVGAVKSLELQTRRRSDFVERFRRDRIMGEMAMDILELAQPK